MTTYNFSDLSHNLLTGSFPDVTQLPLLTYLALEGNSLTGPFPSGASPSSLTICHLDPVLTSDCPSVTVMSDPGSLAGRCALKCRGGGQPLNAVQSQLSPPATSNAGAVKTPGSSVPLSKAKSESSLGQGTAAGQQGSTVSGNDEGETPASLAAAVSSSGTKLRGMFSRDLTSGFSSGVLSWSLCIVLASALSILL